MLHGKSSLLDRVVSTGLAVKLRLASLLSFALERLNLVQEGDKQQNVVSLVGSVYLHCQQVQVSDFEL